MRRIFEPCSLGTLSLKSRIIRSATHEGMAHSNGMPTDDLLRTYRRLAEGGAGAIITGYVSVMQNGKTFTNMRMFDSDASVEAYKSINDHLKQYRTPIILQLAHGGSRSMSRASGGEAVSASRRKRNEWGDRVREASDGEIRSIIDAFVCAVARAKAAGFDGVELHAAHGYLLSEFISPVLNKRRDKWGGSTENRLRIVTEIMAGARREVGNFPILIKMSAQDEFKRGLTGAEAVTIARMLQAATCDGIEVSCGYGDFMHVIRVPRLPIDAALHFFPRYRNMPGFQKRLMKLIAPFLAKVHRPLHNYNVDAAALIKRNVDIPVIVVGGIRNLSDIRTIIMEKGIDFVSMSRPFIIEPDIVKRFQKGQESSRCINCGHCLFGVIDGHLKCYYGKVPSS